MATSWYRAVEEERMIHRALSLCLILAVVGLISGCTGQGATSDESNSDSGASHNSAEQAQADSEGSPDEDGGSAENGEGELTPVDVSSPVHGSSYVAPLVEVFGDVRIGEHSFVASNTILRASPDNRLEIGSETNAQDNIVMGALGTSSTIGDETSIAHHAIVRDSDIGDFAFVGFNAEVVNSTVGEGAFIQHGAHVEGVEIPENAYVDVGQEVTTQEQADALPEAEPDTEEFRREVLDVNKEFAEGYIELYDSGDGYEEVIAVGPNPETSFNPEQVEPQIGEGTEIGEFVRIIGDVRVGENSDIEQRTAIRADEGTPIIIGARASIDDRVTFHALKGTDIRIGDDLTAADDVVLHGPLEMGDGISVEDDAVVFRVVVEDAVEIGEGAIIAGPAPEEEGGELPLRIPEGTNIPAGAVITSTEDLEALCNLIECPAG
jgi:carbon dioxide concentrating mechanism protein CcmM